MSTIHELNERRCTAESYLKALGMLNTPTDAEEQLKARAQYRLAYDAWMAAEKEFTAAINGLSAGELTALASGIGAGIGARAGDPPA